MLLIAVIDIVAGWTGIAWLVAMWLAVFGPRRVPAARRTGPVPARSGRPMAHGRDPADQRLADGVVLERSAGRVPGHISVMVFWNCLTSLPGVADAPSIWMMTMTEVPLTRLFLRKAGKSISGDTSVHG